METNPIILDLLVALQRDLTKLIDEVQAIRAEARLTNEMLAARSFRRGR
jgi:hypothetical protein